MKIDKYYWYEHKYVGNELIKIDLRMTVPLYFEGVYNELRHIHMMWRKKKGLNIKESWIKGIIK